MSLWLATEKEEQAEGMAGAAVLWEGRSVRSEKKLQKGVWWETIQIMWDLMGYFKACAGQFLTQSDLELYRVTSLGC